VIWPTETVVDARGEKVTNPVARRPDGVEHHYAPLAVVTIVSGTDPKIVPCIPRINRLVS
jgi:hypothetical protein